MNQKKLGAILSYVQIIVSNTISIIYTPYMLRMLGQSEYGLFGTANSYISYLSILSLGIGGAYIRFNARCRARNDREEEKRLNGMFLVIFSCLAILVLIGGILSINIASKVVDNTYTLEEIYKLKVVMFLLTVNMAVTFVCNVVMMALQAYEQFIFIRIVLIATGIIVPIFNIIALKIGGGVISITLISLIVSCFSYLIFFIYAKKTICLGFAFRGFRKEILNELFVFSMYLFLNTITNQLTFSTDNIVLSAVHGTTATAIYTVGSNFKEYFLSFSSNIAAVFAPQINMIVAKRDDKEALNEIFQRIGRLQFYIVSLILIGYSLIGQKFIELWAGKDYYDSFWIGLLLIIAVFIPSFQNIGIEIQKAMNKHKARSIVYFLIAILNIFLTIPASKKWNGIGAAVATTLCMFIGTGIFMNWYYWKKMKLDIVAFWKSIFSILPGFIIPILAGKIFIYFYNISSLVDVLYTSIFIVIVFICSTWKFSMNEYEKNLFRKLINKICKI